MSEIEARDLTVLNALGERYGTVKVELDAVLEDRAWLCAELRKARTALERTADSRDVEWIEERVGMGAGAWDMVPPETIVDAAWDCLRETVASTPERETSAPDHISHPASAILDRAATSRANGEGQ